MKALFLGLPLHGHTNPSLPLVRELVRRGDEVVYYSTEPFAAAIRDTGASCRPYQNAFLADLAHVPERLDELSWLLMRTSAEILASRLDDCRAERPDYVIADSVAPWGQWIAQALGIKAVTSVTTFAFNRHVLTFAAGQGARPKSVRLLLSKIRHVAKALALRRRLRRRYGVSGPDFFGLVMGHSDLNIVYTSREFQPRAESFDDRYVFIGPSIAARTEASEWHPDDVAGPPVIYVSLGTIFNAAPAFYRNCFEAFRDREVRVVMSIGSNISAASLGTPPANVVVHPHVAQLDVLQSAAVFVTHGGMNSVSESLHHGVPMVVVPQMSEQFIVGSQVAAIGAGLCLAARDATAGRLRESVDQVLADPRFRAKAVLMRQSFDAAGGASRGADAILRFTRPDIAVAATGAA